MVRSRSLAGLILAIVIIAAAVMAVAYQAWYSEHGFKSFDEALSFARKSKLITLVFCTKDVPKGEVFTRDDLTVVFHWQPKYPQDAISDPNEVIGKRAILGIKKGQMVGYHDVPRGAYP